MARLGICWKAMQQGHRSLFHAIRRTVVLLSRLLLVAYFLFCILFLALRYIVLPNIDSYKPNVERMATHAIGSKVSIATIEASWSGLRPQLALGDVAIHDTFGNEALRLPKVSATFSWLSIAVGELQLYRLEIDRPDMDILRDSDGNLHVAGIPVDPRKTGDPKAADWVLSQREIVIRNGRLRWIDDKRIAPPLTLEGVTLLLRNHWRYHEFALKAVPPEGVASPVDIRAAFAHPYFSKRISDPTRWTGQMYADLQYVDLAAWKPYVDYPVEMERGNGAVRAWLTFDQAKIADFTADLMLDNVSTRLRKDLEPLNLARVNGRVSVQEAISPKARDGVPTFGANGHAITLTDFSLETDEGLTLPVTTISERFSTAQGNKPERTEISASLLDLKTLAELAGRLPLPAAQLQMLNDYAPRGVLKDFAVQWDGAYPEVSAYRVKGSFEALSMQAQAARPARPKSGKKPAQAAVPAIPGFENLTGHIDASELGGSFKLDSRQLRLELPGYFAEPTMLFDRLDMRAGWAFQESDQLLLEVERMDFEQDGLIASLAGKHLMPLSQQQGKPSGMLDVSGTLSGLQLQKVGKYLPLQTPEHLRSWLSGALVGGVADDLSLKIKGDLEHFPFLAKNGEKPKGEFHISGRLVDGVLNYAPEIFAKDGKAPLWPTLEQVRGTIEFDRTRMEINADSARTHGVVISKAKAVIADLASPDSMLTVEGDAAGPLQEFLQFTMDSPVAGWIANFTEESKGSGNAKLALKMQLPLNHMTDAKVRGVLQFANNNVTLQNDIPPLLGTNGKLEFNEKGFTLHGVRASFVGGPVAVSGGTQSDGSIVVNAEGSVTVDGLRKTYPTAAMQRLSERIGGGARYGATIRVKNKRPEVVIESNLAGLALDFPAPLRKAGSDSLPLKFELIGRPSNTPQLLRDEIKLSLGSAIAVRYEREKAVDKDAQWRVVRGGIGVNQPAPQPDGGLIANVSMDLLDLDAWRGAVTAITATGQPAEAASQPDSLNLMQYIEPEVLAARATTLVVMGRKLDNVVVGASHQKGVWQANIDSEQASGYVTWNESPSGTGLGKVTARLASLVIPKSAASDVSALLEGKNTTTRMPGLDIVAENFELFGKKFGHLELMADNTRASSGVEWRINKLSIVNPDAELTATGKWSIRDGTNLSSLDYTMNIRDAGKLLDRFGFANLLRGGKGRMQGEANWKGLPFSLDIPTLSGQFKLDIAAGQFLKVDPSAAKLLGVLSLQSLPRRLALDFRDVFSEGFAFDGVTADVAISQGVATTNNFKMRSVAATVLMDGSADIAKEATNLHVVVIPDINVGAASVVYALAVNPVIGVGTFLAQLFLRDPLMKAFTFEYQISGPWKEPVVTKLARNQPAPAQDAAGNPRQPG
ncbi:YhdP family protein [Noviherbaspirillum sp.]|uniref:YhdP family protein n=1 Tax=Noviherbaspirillum sp. TaxID=1926288 RepID=UPI002FE379ED